MSDRCPKCGAQGQVLENGITFYTCTSEKRPPGKWPNYGKRATFFESEKCLRNQLAQAQEELAEMQEVWHEDNQALGEAIIEIADLQAHNVQLSWMLERIGNLCRDNSDSGMTARQLGSEIVGLVDEALSSSPVNPYAKVVEAAEHDYNSAKKACEYRRTRGDCHAWTKRGRECPDCPFEWFDALPDALENLPGGGEV